MKSKDLRLLLSRGSSRKLFFGAIAGAIINTGLILGNAFLVASVIVGIIYSHPTVIDNIAELGLLWLTRSLFTSQFDHWASNEASRLKRELRADVLASKSIVIATPSNHLSTLLIKGANSLDVYLARFLPQMFGAALTPLAAITAMAFLDVISAVIALITLPIIPIFGALIGKYTNDVVSAKWQTLGTLAKYFEDSLRGLHTLAIFGRHKSQSARIKEMGDSYTTQTMKVLRISFLSALVLELAATISVALIAVSIGLRLVSGSISFFPALAVLVLAPEVYFPLRNAASLFHASADGGAALSDLMDIKAKNLDEHSEGATLIGEVKKVQWSDWQSPFGNGELESMQLHAGEILVLRGGSGLGKTTFLNSLIGLNKSSDVRINDLDLRQYRERSLFNQVGWIPQNPSLISGSVRDLFSYLHVALKDEDIVNLLEQVGLSLDQLPSGLDTMIGGVGEKSGKISGGQKRRIAIARALAINPSLIIADEVTADLDPESAKKILRLLEDFSRKGAIVIAVLHAPDQKFSGAREIVMSER